MKRTTLFLLVILLILSALGTSGHRFPLCKWHPWMCKTPTPTATVTVEPTSTPMPTATQPAIATYVPRGTPGYTCMGPHCRPGTKSP